MNEASREFLVRYGGDVFPNLFRSAKGTIVTDSDGRQVELSSASFGSVVVGST